MAITLLGMARLAEYAAAQSQPALILALWILRPAEWLAREFVAGLSQDLGAQQCLRMLKCSPMPPDHPAVPTAEALRLAAALRLLAGLLNHLAILTAGTGRPLAPARLALLLSVQTQDDTLCASRLLHAHRRVFDAYVDTS